jgi:hypothetical protein
MIIAPNEIEIRCIHSVVDGEIRYSEGCERIQQLLRSHLKKLAASADGWEVLYVDPNDGRHWELTYPQSNQQGGGPRVLTVLPDEVAKAKYPTAFPA